MKWLRKLSWNEANHLFTGPETYLKVFPKILCEQPLSNDLEESTWKSGKDIPVFKHPKRVKPDPCKIRTKERLLDIRLFWCSTF